MALEDFQEVSGFSLSSLISTGNYVLQFLVQCAGFVSGQKASTKALPHFRSGKGMRNLRRALLGGWRLPGAAAPSLRPRA